MIFWGVIDACKSFNMFGNLYYCYKVFENWYRHDMMKMIFFTETKTLFGTNTKLLENIDIYEVVRPARAFWKTFLCFHMDRFKKSFHAMFFPSVSRTLLKWAWSFYYLHKDGINSVSLIFFLSCMNCLLSQEEVQLANSIFPILWKLFYFIFHYSRWHETLYTFTHTHTHHSGHNFLIKTVAFSVIRTDCVMCQLV